MREEPPRVHPVTVRLDVPFHDVDSVQVVWHGHYLKYFEVARSALLRSIGYDVPDMLGSGFGWPVIETSCKHVAPLRYGDTFQVTARLLETDVRLKVGYEVHAADGRRIARGYTVQVAVDLATSEMCFASPPVLLERLAAAEDIAPRDGSAPG